MEREFRMKKRAEEVFADLVHQRDKARAEARKAKEELGKKMEEAEKWKRKFFRQQKRADSADAAKTEMAADADKVIERTDEAIKENKKLKIKNRKLRKQIDVMEDTIKDLRKKLRKRAKRSKRENIRKDIIKRQKEDFELFNELKS